MNKTKLVTFRLSIDSIDELISIAKKTERKKNWLVQKAINNLIRQFKLNQNENKKNTDSNS